VVQGVNPAGGVESDGGMSRQNLAASSSLNRSGVLA
jgi:hypothetical protein